MPHNEKLWKRDSRSNPFILDISHQFVPDHGGYVSLHREQSARPGKRNSPEMKSVLPTHRKYLQSALILFCLLLTGCAHYQGLDPAFADQPRDRNRILIGWCITQADNDDGDSSAILGAVLENIADELREKKYVVRAPERARSIQQEGTTNRISADETLVSLIQLHQSALTNTRYHWTEQSKPIVSLFHPFERFERMTNALNASWKWPPMNISPAERASADAILFWITEYHCEELETSKKRRKENWVRAPLVIGLGIPLAILGGGMAGAPSEIIKGNTSWMKHSVLLLNPEDGAIFYRHHRFFESDDARDIRTLRSNIRGLFDELPNGD
jgi:hypothetical protein